MPELFSQKLKANFTPEQQDYYLQLENELKELLGGQTQEEVLASGDPAIIQQILKIKQEMLNFVLTKKTREMTRQEEKERLKQEKRSISLDEIERKQKAGEELTDNELRFLYRIDGFGYFYSEYSNERRVLDIIKKRNVKQDVSYLLDCDEEQVSLTEEEFLNNKDILYHCNNLILPTTNMAQLKLPKYVRGILQLPGVTNATGLIFPEVFQVHLPNLQSTVGLEFPDSIKFVAVDARMPDKEFNNLRIKYPQILFTKFT